MPTKEESAVLAAAPLGSAASGPSASWTWSQNGDALITGDGRFVLYPRAEATCGREGDDYYACQTAKASASLFVDPAQRALLAAAPDLLAALEEGVTALSYHLGGNLSPATARSACKAMRAALSKAKGA